MAIVTFPKRVRCFMALLERRKDSILTRLMLTLKVIQALDQDLTKTKKISTNRGKSHVK
jgi:hypothetical protein